MSGGSALRSIPKPSAEIALSARIVDKNGKVVAARLFEESEKFDQVAPPAARCWFSEAFRTDREEYDHMDNRGVVGETGLKPWCCGSDRAWLSRLGPAIRGLQIRQQVVESDRDRAGTAGMVGWPVWMPSASDFSQGFDRITLVPYPERRRDLERALVQPGRWRDSARNC